MRINLHARIEIALATALLLGSCAGPSLTDKQKDEVTDIADDVTDSAIADNEKVQNLESRVSAIEDRLGM